MKAKKLLYGLLSSFFIAFSFLILTACDRGEHLAKHPTEEYVMECLEKIPNVTEIEAVTEINDPQGLLNKAGGYTAHVYFALDAIDQSKVYGTSLIDKGTAAGGSIEVYKNKRDANKRNEYLAVWDGNVFSSGSHTVYGTCVIRTSNHLTATNQKTMEENIIYALSGEDDKIVKLEPSYKPHQHIVTVIPAVEATCTETGLTEGKYCYICNEVLVKQKTTEMTDHNFVNSVCTVCNSYYYTEGLKLELIGESYSVVRGTVTYNNPAEIIIPAKYNGKPVTHISDRAFYGMSQITSIKIPNSVTSIGEYAMAGCSLTSITIPDSVTIIGKGAFTDCRSLNRVIIGKGVTNIEKGAFYICSSLTTVYYTGTKEQWNLITIEENNERLTNSTIVYNYIPEEEN